MGESQGMGVGPVGLGGAAWVAGFALAAAAGFSAGVD